ncbi:hypothetical protein [Methylomagnum sp.]
MSAVLNPVLEFLAVEKARLRRGASRSALGVAVALFAMLAALEGLMILLVGGYTSLAESREPWVAGMIVGGIMILAAAIVLAVVAQSLRPGRVPEPPPVAPPRFAQERGGAGSPSLLKAAAAEVIDRADIKVRDIALIALVAGLALGISPRLRSQLLGRKLQK